MNSKIQKFVFMMCFLSTFSLPLAAQLNLGRIFGGITDESGGAIVDATVTVLDVQRGVTRPLVTDSAGQYSAPSLQPGTYTVRVEAKGFKTIDRSDIAVGVGQDIRIDLTLQPGEQTQTVTVTGAVPQVNTTNAQLGGTIENQEINELPINGRQYTHLLDYHPGILAKPGAGSQGFLSNGGRPEAQVWMLDGLYNVNIYNASSPVIGGATAAAGPDQATILPIDAIQEVNVIENPKAEYGWKPGAIVNIGLKSGTNSIHGTAFAFGRNDAMDARNPFLASIQAKAAVELEQWGGSIGGPIKKDKLFYFGAFEAQNYTFGNPKLVQIPTSASGAGTGSSFPDAIAAIKKLGLTPNTLSLNLAGCTASGACNAANGIFGNAGALQADPIALLISGGSHNFIAKTDYHINDHNSLNGEFVYGLGNFLYPSSAIQQYWEIGLKDQIAEVARAVWAWTPNANWVNEARLGIEHSNASANIAECGASVGQPNYAALGFTTGLPQNPPACGFPVITITGFSSLGQSGPISGNNFNTYEGSDSVSYTRGRHLFKFGGELRHSSWTGASYTAIRGTLSFGSVSAFSGATPLEDFLMGTPASGTALFGDPLRTVSVNAYSAFIQDDWRVTSRLTANLGLRYEYEPPITASNNLIGNFNPRAPEGLVQETSSTNVYNGDKNNFAPRLGLAWDLTGKGTTVVRAGAGVVYTTTALLNLLSSPQGATLSTIPTGFTFVQPNGTRVAGPGNINVGTGAFTSSQLQWAPNAPIFGTSAASLACGNGLGSVNPNAATGPTNPGNPAPCALHVLNPNFLQGYVTTWTLGVQHAFTNNLSLDLSYVGNHGTKLASVIDLNQPAPGAKNGGTAPSSGAEQIRRPYYSQFPYYSQIFYYSGNENSNYNGLQAALTQRTSHGLSFTVGYTFAHALDVQSTDTANGSPAVMNSNDPNLDYGAASWDVRHHLTVTTTYVIPGKKSPGQILEGWQLNSAVTLLSAFPWNAYDAASDISGTGELLDRWYLSGNPGDFTPGGRTPIPCFGAKGCTAAIPAACTTAAASVPTGPTGQTGLQALAALGCYMEGSSVIVPATQGTFGTMGRDVLRGKGFSEWDTSISKNTKLFKERLTAQFRAEFFNVLNHVNYAPGGTTGSSLSSPTSFGQSASTPDTANPVIGSGGPREIQLGLKFIF